MTTITSTQPAIDAYNMLANQESQLLSRTMMALNAVRAAMHDGPAALRTDETIANIRSAEDSVRAAVKAIYSTKLATAWDAASVEEESFVIEDAWLATIVHPQFVGANPHRG